MFIQQNRCKYLSSLVLGTIFFISMTSANCFTAWAENSSQIIIKETSEQTSKPVVRPSRKKSKTKYNVETGPVKIIGPQKQNQRADEPSRTHGESVSSSNDKSKIEIGPVKKISPVVPENLKTGDNVKTGRQRPLPEGAEISGNIKIEPISKPREDVRLEHRSENGKRIRPEEPEMDNIEKKVSTPIPIEQTEKADKNFEIQTVPIKAMETENAQTSQPPLVERIKVTGVRAWKLDKSGNKTNEATTDNMRVIEEINQPPADIELK